MTGARWAQATGALLIACLMLLLWPWAVQHAVFRADAAACQALAHAGACWGVVPAKAQGLLLGFYPKAESWRPMLWLAGVGLTLWGLSKPDANTRRRAAWALLLAWPLGLWALGGGPGLVPVPAEQWGGLPLTVLIAVSSYALSWPLAIGLASARQSGPAPLRVLAVMCIEGVRGVPLVSLLFLAAFVLPRFTPQPDSLSLLSRATLVMALFSAAYLAEILRAGLQTVPREQAEAASTLGLGWWGTQRSVVWPQACRAVLPALTSHAIGLFKETSLVLVIGLHELTGSLSLSLGGDPEWRPFYFEAYLFVGVIYGLVCWGMSRLGAQAEQRWPQAR